MIVSLQMENFDLQMHPHERLQNVSSHMSDNFMFHHHEVLGSFYVVTELDQTHAFAPRTLFCLESKQRKVSII